MFAKELLICGVDCLLLTTIIIKVLLLYIRSERVPCGVWSIGNMASGLQPYTLHSQMTILRQCYY